MPVMLCVDVKRVRKMSGSKKNAVSEQFRIRIYVIHRGELVLLGH